MGLYVFISNEDRITKRKVSDKVINDIFQDALKCDPSLMIEKYTHLKKIKKGWFMYKYIEEDRYNVLHETPALNGSAYQARLQSSGSGEKKIVLAYLFGIINGGSLFIK